MNVGSMRYTATIYTISKVITETGTTKDERVLFLKVPCGIEGKSTNSNPSSGDTTPTQTFLMTTRYIDKVSDVLLYPDRFVIEFNRWPNEYFKVRSFNNYRGLDRYLTIDVVRTGKYGR